MASFAAAPKLHSSLVSAPAPRLSPLERLKQHRARPAASARPLRHARLVVNSASTPNVNAEVATTRIDIPAAAVQEVPGSYGLPLLGVALARLNYFVLQGKDEYFLSRMRRYKSSVIRVLMPPGRPFFPDSRTIMLLDQKSIRILFDMSKVEKKDVFAGTYMPSTAFTGGFRVLPYLDPSEPKHTSLKEFCFEMLKSSGRKFLPELHSGFLEAAKEWDVQIEAKGEAEFSNVSQSFTLGFLSRAILGVDPRTPGPASLGDKGPSMILAWVALQLAPQTSLGLPKLIEAVFHTIPLPFFLVSSQYNKLYRFFFTNGQQWLDMAAEKFGLDRVEACHNLLYFVCFNTWGGFLILMPSIIKWIASAGVSFQKELAQDVRAAVGPDGELTMKALQEMKLVHSTVYEVLRIDPPVPFQYGRAKSDMIVESQDAAYRVREGELLGGYQNIAMRDPKVFEAPDTFKPTRFMGAEGQKLLQSLTWSNGPESTQPSSSNKQCAGKDFVHFVARAFIAELFLRYDSFEIGASSGQGATSSVTFTALRKREEA